MRLATRYNKRTREYSSAVPETEWRNRVYQASLSYGSDQAPLYFAMGRIISSRLSGIGYIDGFLAQKSLTENTRVGGFGGTQPTWQYSSFQSSLQKYGAFAVYTRGEAGERRLESSAALAGEYHGGTVSREFLFLRNSFDLGGRWNLFQSAEIDVNRAWRKDKTGEGLSLTNLFVSGRGRLTERISAGLSFDNRKNYWTFDTKTLADSLFDDVMRQGLRADLSFRPGAGLYVFTNAGYRKRTGDSEATYSYSLTVNKNGLFAKMQFLNLQASGFSGPLTDGYNLSARTGLYFRGGDMISLAYGAYIYDFSSVLAAKQLAPGERPVRPSAPPLRLRLVRDRQRRRHRGASPPGRVRIPLLRT